MPGEEFYHSYADSYAEHGQFVASRPAHEPGPGAPHNAVLQRFCGRRFVDRAMAEVDELVGDVDF